MTDSHFKKQGLVPEITSKVLSYNLNPMTQKIRYCGRREDGHMAFLSLTPKEALSRGKSFEQNGYEMTLTELDELCYHMHKHCPHLNVRMSGHHEFTIKELYNMCPEILLDLLDLNGGTDYIAQILIGYEELYNQEQSVRIWRENQE